MPVRPAGRAAMTAVATAALAGLWLAPAAAAGHPGAAQPQASATAATRWSQFGFDAAHTGGNPSEHILSPGNVAGLRLKWAAPADGRVDSSAAVAGGVVYFPSNDRLYAVRAAIGKKLWSFGFVNAFFSDPAVAGRIVYTGSVHGHVSARDAATGKKVWTFAIPGSPHANYPPVVANGVVYAAANGASNGALAGFVYALDAATGKKLWSSTRTAHVPTGVAAAGGAVYETTSDDDGFAGGAYALDAAAGTVLWHMSTRCTVPHPGCVLTSPVVANGILYAGAAAGTGFARLQALKASTGCCGRPRRSARTSSTGPRPRTAWSTSALPAQTPACKHSTPPPASTPGPLPCQPPTAPKPSRRWPTASSTSPAQTKPAPCTRSTPAPGTSWPASRPAPRSRRPTRPSSTAPPTSAASTSTCTPSHSPSPTGIRLTHDRAHDQHRRIAAAPQTGTTSSYPHQRGRPGKNPCSDPPGFLRQWSARVRDSPVQPTDRDDPDTLLPIRHHNSPVLTGALLG
jgi:hypothetical protein